MSKGSTPPQPDYNTLIPQQREMNREDFNTVLSATRPAIRTPTGTTTWTRSPGAVREGDYRTALDAWKQRSASYTAPQTQTSPTGEWGQQITTTIPGQGIEPGDMPTEDQFRDPDSWSMEQALSPEEQAIFSQDQQTRLSTGQGMQDILANLDTGPLDASDPDRLKRLSEAMYNSRMRYLEPSFDKQTQRTRDDLLSQGFNYLDDAAQDPMERVRDDQNQARLQAADVAEIGAGQEDSRLLQAELLRRKFPLEMLSTLRTGSQPNTDFGQAQYGAPGLQGVDSIGAANDAYGNQIEAMGYKNAARAQIISAFMNMIGSGIKP